MLERFTVRLVDRDRDKAGGRDAGRGLTVACSRFPMAHDATPETWARARLTSDPHEL
jgi:hypothetical protein